MSGDRYVCVCFEFVFVGQICNFSQLGVGFDYGSEREFVKEN
jgi:hypothetical protein